MVVLLGERALGSCARYVNCGDYGRGAVNKQDGGLIANVCVSVMASMCLFCKEK